MALDVVEKIKEAEKEADSIVAASKEEAKMLLADTEKLNTKRRKDFERKLAEERAAEITKAEDKAKKIKEKAETDAADQCSRLLNRFERKKNKAIDLVIDEILK